MANPSDHGHGPGHGHAAGDHGAHAHPGPATYTKVAVILGIITVIEVAIVYISALRGVMVPALLALSALKFALVAMYYMHLKFDPTIYTRLITAGLTIATIIIVSLMVLQFHNGFLP